MPSSSRSKVSPFVSTWFQTGHRADAWYILFILLFSAAVYFYNAVRYAFPIGFAGLYVSMAEQLYQHHWVLPVTVPYYGPGGIPLAYPPLAMYVLAVFVYQWHIPVFAYLRFFPAAVSVLSFVPVYFLAKRILKFRSAAFFSVLLGATAPVIYYMQAAASGAVRGLAFLLCLAGLSIALYALEEQKGWPYLLAAAVLGGLTVLTHFTYALFFYVSLAAFAIQFPLNKKKLAQAAIITFISLLVTIPWFATVIHFYGIQVLASAAGSHGTSLTLTLIKNNPGNLIIFFYRLIAAFQDAPVLGGLAMVGLFLCIRSRQWRITIWFMLSLVIVSEGARFLNMIGGLLAGFAILPFLEGAQQAPLPGRKKIATAILAACLLILSANTLWNARQIASARPVLSPAALELGAWFQKNTPAGSSFLLLQAGKEEAAEWFPYLLKREPCLGHWGAEWNNTYDRQFWLFGQLEVVLQKQAFQAVEAFTAENQLEVSYLITPADSAGETLNGQLHQNAGWALAYQNEGYAVWKNLAK